ncbi:MAG: hypothetical protein LBF81_05360 [Prevotellaceae bacterium]|jgi:hypothetical protein|nr:hypothetical protein [Prevotellaceae bacterium]
MKTNFIKKHFFLIFFDGLTESKIKERKSIYYSSVKFFNHFYGFDGLTERIFGGRKTTPQFDGYKSVHYCKFRQIRQTPFLAFDGAKPQFDGRKSSSYLLLRQIIPGIAQNRLKNVF